MEAAEALGRGGLASLLEPAREAIRARSRLFWTVTGLTLLAAGLRFATLGLQAYHHDEIVTASRVLRADFVHAMEAVGFSESAPPLYYALAWFWTQLAGTDEVGLRSLSALVGVATVPVAFLLGAELRGRRAGVAAAALVAVNPMLIWYSQEARAYALLVLLTSLAALFFVRALRTGGRRDLSLWGAFSALALASHYFALFPALAEGAWLLRRHGRAALAGLRFAIGAAVLLAPLAIHQMLAGRAEWIGSDSLALRVFESAVALTVGEIGHFIAQPERPLLGLVPLLAIAAALLLLAFRAEEDERRAAGRMLVIVAATVLIPVALALAPPGKDFVLARNLLPAAVPLLVLVAIAASLRRAQRGAAAAAAVLFLYSLGFSVAVNFSPSLQRPDWRAVAERLGEPEAPRAMVTWMLGQASLRWYLSTGSFQPRAEEGHSWYVHEIVFVSDGPAPPPPRHLLGPGFRQVSYEPVGRLHLRRYRMPGVDLAPLRLRRVDDARLNFRTNSVLLDGIGPG